jgi:hypothetical protein
MHPRIVHTLRYAKDVGENQVYSQVTFVTSA